MKETEKIKKCPHCDKDISFRAKKCPYCQSDLRSWVNRHPILAFLSAIILLPFFLMIVVGSTTDTNESVEQTPRRESFRANVNFTGTQFVISNLDDVDCLGSQMSINGGLLKGGYELNDYNLRAGETYTVGALQFADDSGNRFNPLTTKPKTFYIYCRGNNELHGTGWGGEFN
ncbi:hypothetical protein A3A76_04430 [Candidatus Woesebacteria bacterium RIFCSPLOWO2_01_FULL_39_23]|uniref:Putative zinc-ribbon domain-containing protein n=1 Tax=Candidatus Woesebacteria bacterium RIFCSPHIGHO2_01_FULL_40_22 TaxID=1802499 RepID=A0A1F7YHC9_9BACT|nr:MAG: hypothetical protein A2141_01995 [Candidatus Woesebacteria bacterium RBG_16_40_11]OGM25998.1 MAG: hypothetical protein A2628_00430 [Candidatus Woesebacteria bacterium RIFCSPHIGHO2_01_FULL_40_22]OGM37084.1 MAG: hypothetical protein A3E41_00760 [Candidatus Woesebacteria bacterium RIFCSPHIGHO2_12_FULL_38_9]OGM61847.1 MAG: hypothetical protein A3A76_04430 [Candidatus Woesebacteria bacterium RIFCSPLOWO2_01_FULL_39_23]